MEHSHSSAAEFEACADCKEKAKRVNAQNNHHAIYNMERALNTYRTRNRVYGNNYKRFGAIMVALYPNGVKLKTVAEWNRFGILIQKISKLSRYVTDPMAGHIDSIHDDGVYSFMLEELDAEQAGLYVAHPADILATEVKLAEALPSDCEHVYKYPCRSWPEAQWCAAVPHTCGRMRCINCGAYPESE